MQAEGNIPADSFGSRTETVSLVTLSFVYVILLFFPNIFVKLSSFLGPYFWFLTKPVWKTRNISHILVRLCSVLYSENRIKKPTKRCILYFPMKDDFGITKNNRIIILTDVASNIYKALFSIVPNLLLRKFLRKIKNILQEMYPHILRL